MKKMRGIICTLVCILCILAWLQGCSDSQQPPPKAKVVRKKIVAQPAAAVPGSKTVPGSSTTANARNDLMPKADIAMAASAAPIAQQSVSDTADATPLPVPRSDSAPSPKQAAAPATMAQASPPAKETPPAESASAPPAAVSKPTTSSAPAPSAEMQPPALAQPPAALQAAAPTATEPLVIAGDTEPNKPGAVAVPAPDQSGTRPLYNPLGKTDPFEPLFKDEPDVPIIQAQKKKRIPRTPLERIDLGQLKLVGIIMAPSGNRALVEESSGKGYIIKDGTYIGLNAGKVVDIRRDRVIVEEQIEDVVGNPTIRNKELVLPKPAGD
jgi:type IV pilus assembly protein PilP